MLTELLRSHEKLCVECKTADINNKRWEEKLYFNVFVIPTFRGSIIRDINEMRRKHLCNKTFAFSKKTGDGNIWGRYEIAKLYFNAKFFWVNNTFCKRMQSFLGNSKVWTSSHWNIIFPPIPYFSHHQGLCINEHLE